MNNLSSNQAYINPEVLHVMKTGGVPMPFLKDYIKELQQPDYPLDFVVFMDQMISESDMDRKTIIARSGLSESLAYKYLNGNKKTTERDYILALCIALHLNFPQTQHAIRCCGLPLLGQYDLRATIIRWGIEQGLDRYQIDEYLENAGFPLIKVSNDMPSAEIKDSMYTETDKMQMSETEFPAFQSIPNFHTDEYEEIESYAKAIHDGNAPFDFDYFGHMSLKDKEGKTYHLEAIYLVTGETFFYVMNDKQYEIHKKMIADMESDNEAIENLCFDSDRLEGQMNVTGTEYQIDPEETVEVDVPKEKLDFLESYISLLEATASKFFPYFMELDHLTDKKVAEVMSDVNDTRNYPYRVGSHWIGGNKPEIYIEMFNRAQPEHREYYQIIETEDHECTYTASHESYYMQIEMTDLYDVYFTKRREPEYFLQATDKDFDKLDKRYQMIFNNLRHNLHSYVRSIDSFVKIPDEQFYEEESEFFAELFIISMRSGNLEQAKQALLEQENAVKLSNLSEVKKLTQLTIIDMRKYHVALNEGNPEEAERIREIIISRKQDALRYEKELGDDTSTVFTVIADALLDKWRSLQQNNSNLDSKEKLEEILELMDHGAFSDEQGYSKERFELYQAYAYQLERHNAEKAEKYYLKAIKEAAKHHLDQQPFTAAAVAGTYNNYAWLLWNIFANEEAIMYYGRALELAETYLENGILPPEQAKAELAHYGAALIKIYEATSRQKEKDRILRRLLESRVIPEETKE